MPDEAQTEDLQAIDAKIDEWLEKTNALSGGVVQERQPWNNEVTADSIRHFCQGTDDDNPLWLDPDHAAKTGVGKLQAPPAYLVSVLYPMLHGAPMKAPLASLIGGVTYTWQKRICLGDSLRPESRQQKNFEKRNKQGRRLNFVISEITYRNQDAAVVGVANGTMIMATQVGRQVMMEHEMPHYDDAQIKAMEATWRAEQRRGAETRHVEDVEVGEELPSILRGPLTIGDMVTWNAAIGPAYKGGRWGYLDLTKAMHTAAVNPVTGFPVKYSQQHEDFHLAAGHGMAAPFDNGVMRFAWVAPLVTNWMGDDGFLRMLNVQVRQPGLYGDLITYGATVTEVDRATGIVKMEITGRKPDGSQTTGGGAEVELPGRS